MKFAPSEDAVTRVEVTTKALTDYIHPVAKALAGFETIKSSFERSSTVGEMLSNNTAFHKAIICEGKNQSMWQTLLLSYFKKLSQPTQVSTKYMYILYNSI